MPDGPGARASYDRRRRTATGGACPAADRGRGCNFFDSGRHGSDRPPSQGPECPLPRIPRAARAVLSSRSRAVAPAVRGVAGPGAAAAPATGPRWRRGRCSRATSGRGRWFAIAVDSRTPDPRSRASCASAAASDSRTRFGTPVELATGSRKTYLLYAQPPSFGGNMKVQLVSGDDGGLRGQGRHRLARPDPARRRRGLREPGEARRRAQAPAQPVGRRSRRS